MLEMPLLRSKEWLHWVHYPTLRLIMTRDESKLINSRDRQRVTDTDEEFNYDNYTICNIL